MMHAMVLDDRASRRRPRHARREPRHTREDDDDDDDDDDDITDDACAHAARGEVDSYFCVYIDARRAHASTSDTHDSGRDTHDDRDTRAKKTTTTMMTRVCSPVLAGTARQAVMMTECFEFC